ncbi:LysR family transcriptional regulator [Bradyrhizobium sp. 2TAF24]|uniref:LysR family transcriptional regulator n=1 Tax=Bradyrhizobium sp. 2TAF24 TaxID=3233011 RepID=UPI003F8DB05B
MAASRAQPTISVQIGTLKEALGTALFRRARRRLELTVLGQLALEPSLRFDTYDHLIEGRGPGCSAARR